MILFMLIPLFVERVRNIAFIVHWHRFILSSVLFKRSLKSAFCLLPVGSLVPVFVRYLKRLSEVKFLNSASPRFSQVHVASTRLKVIAGSQEALLCRVRDLSTDST